MHNSPGIFGSTSLLFMKDIQSLEDTRRVNIRKVGVRNISYPITVLDKAHEEQHTVAHFNMYVNLPHQFKGTHMSRFIEILHCFHGRFNLKTLHLVLQEMKNRLNAQAAHLEIRFPYFYHPSGRASSFRSQRYDCLVHGTLEKELDLVVEVQVPVALCSTDKSMVGPSPGLWGKAIVAVRFNHFVWLEALIEMIERGVVPHDTVERICRRISAIIAENSGCSWYRVVVENIGRGYSTSASIEGP